MKTYSFVLIFIVVCASAPLNAQTTANADGNYAKDIVMVSAAQQQALDQAQQMLAQGQGDRAALDTAIKEMQRSQTALAAAKNSPDKLPDAIAAEQAAYQALLKAMPREFRVQRSQNSGQQNQGNSAGQPNQQQLNQLDLTDEQNRYETERQATTPQSVQQNAQQREQTQVADRLKELAQRQQDLNDRMRELQTALQAAHTDQEREAIQEQLKRLADEQRQQLANVDELRQQLAQSPNASSETSTRQQLDQTRSDMQRASEELQNQSASQALAAGTRAQQSMQNMRDDLRRQTSSQFSEQMRQLRSEARNLAMQQDNITSNLDLLSDGNHQSLDDSAQRQQIVRQIAQQQSALTNLLAGMKDVTEQAETTEPLLSQQLYDTLRRAAQMHTDNLLDVGSQLTARGFLPQASQAARMANTNITEIASSVQRAADSVLGSETDELRYAQRQLDDLSRQVEREIGATNSSALAAGENGSAQDQSNRLSRAAGRLTGGTNELAGTNGMAGGESQFAGNNSQRQQRGEGNNPGENQNGNRSQQANGRGENGEQASAQNGQNGQRGQGEAQTANNGQRGDNQQQADNNSRGQQNNSDQPGGNGQRQGGRNGGEQQAANGGGGNADRLRQFAEQLGQRNRAQNNGGPITGNDYVNFSDQLRDVQSVLDDQDLRNQLATVSDRVAAFRGEYRDHQQVPSAEAVRQQILAPLTQVRVWVQEELARQENVNSLVPLDRDPVPDNYSDLVREYYEKLGSAK